MFSGRANVGGGQGSKLEPFSVSMLGKYERELCVWLGKVTFWAHRDVRETLWRERG